MQHSHSHLLTVDCGLWTVDCGLHRAYAALGFPDQNPKEKDVNSLTQTVFYRLVSGRLVLSAPLLSSFPLSV